AGVVIDAAAEARGEFYALHVDAMRGEESSAVFEKIERGTKRELRVSGKRAQCAGRFVRISGDREEALDQAAGLARESGRDAERSLFEKAVGDLIDGASADRGDSGNRNQIGDKSARAFRIRAGHGGKHAFVFRTIVARDERELFEIV